MNRKHRSSLPLALLALATTAIAGLPIAAQAGDPELSFYPAQAWNVSQAGPNCSVASQFNNGFVLDFNGHGQGADGLSIDFRQNVFEAGKDYNVSLSIPGVQNQSLKAQGASAQTLFMSLPNQAGFYKALQSAAVMDIKIENNNFRFYLTGFGKATQAFEKCLNDTRIAAMPVEQQQYMVNEAMAMESKIKPSEMVVAADTTPPALSTTETRSLGGQPVNAAVFEDVPIAPAAPRKRLSEELAEQMADDPSLLAGEETSMPSQEALSPVMPEPSFVPESQPVVTEASMKVTSADIGETAPMEPAIMEEAPGAIKTVRAKTPPFKVNKETVKAEVDFTGLDNVEPASTNDDWRNDDAPFNARISELQRTVENLQAENNALNDELKTALREGETERLSISSNNWDLERATMRFNEAERQIKRMGQDLQSERAKCEMEKKDLEAMLFDPKVTDKQQLAKLAALEAQLAKAKEELNMQRMRYEERIRTLETRSQ